jgi:uncharacterized DUF497 family protein
VRYRFLWDYESEIGNVDHIAEHGLTTDDVESAFEDIQKHTTSRSSRRPAIWGVTDDGRVIFVAYEVIDKDENLIYVHTAFEKESD